MYGSPHGPAGTSLWHSSTLGPAKIPSLSTLDPHAFKLTTRADPNDSLVGGMSSWRELCSPKTNSWTPLVAFFNWFTSLIPWREWDMILDKSSKIAQSSKPKSALNCIIQGIQSHSGRILGTSQRVTRSLTWNLPLWVPRFGYNGTQWHGYVAVTPPPQVRSTSLIQNHPYQDLASFI